MTSLQDLASRAGRSTPEWRHSAPTRSLNEGFYSFCHGRTLHRLCGICAGHGAAAYRWRVADRHDGRRVALEVIRHHRLVELFLVESLGMTWDEVHAEAEVLEYHGATGKTFFRGETVLAEAAFFRDQQMQPWIRFTLSSGAPWDLPVTISGSEIRWTDVNGSRYALRVVGHGHLTGLAGFSGDSAAKIDLTCAGSDARHT